MAIRERLIYAIDVVTDGAKTGLAGFRTAVKEADTTTGKFKAGAGAAFASIKANAGAMAVTAGAAIVGFGIKASQTFTQLALDAEKFALATSQSTEDASRWIEVAGDLGITTEQVQGGFVRLEKAIGANSPAIKALGIEVVRTKDGAADMSATMLQAITALSGVEDPAMKAKLASELFGRGFADMSELVLGDAKAIKEALDDVSESKIIDAEEVAKAKQNRETLDELKDTIEDLTLALGENFLPVIKGAAEGLQALNDVAQAIHLDDLIGALDDFDQLGTDIGQGIRGFFDGAAQENFELVDRFNESERAAREFDRTLLNGLETFESVRQKVLDLTGSQHTANTVALEWQKTQEESTESTEAATAALGLHAIELTTTQVQADALTAATEAKEQATKDAEQADKEAAEAAEAYRETLESVREAMEKQRDAALDLVGGDIAVRDAQRDAAASAVELNDILADTETTMGEAGAAIDEAADSHLRAATAAGDYRIKQMEANGEAVNAQTKAQIYKEELQKLVSQLDGPLAAALQQYIDDLAAIPTTVNTNLTLTRNQDTNERFGNRGIGGPVSPGGLYQVNESGPEVYEQGGRTFIIPSRNGRVTPAGAGVGDTYNLTIINNRDDIGERAISRAILMARLAR